MPAANQHLYQAKHNIRFLETFYNKQEFSDWVLTIAYYTAIHLIESAIFQIKEIKYKEQKIHVEHSGGLFNAVATKNIPLPLNYQQVTRHQKRLTIVSENFPEIANEYNRLSNQSYIAGYRYYRWNDSEIVLVVDNSLPSIVKWHNKKFESNIGISLL